MRKKIVAGNWKMNKTLDEARATTREVIEKITSVDRRTLVVLCVPSPFVVTLAEQIGDAPVAIGAQNCSEFESGAYTGEVSAMMLKSSQVQYVIIGHSERRQYFAEAGKLLAAKVDRALDAGLTPIFCCGEPLDVREKGMHEALVRQQLTESLFHLSLEAILNVVIAYEPVWAIGTGKTATSEQAQSMHAVIRAKLAEKYNSTIAAAVSILYGGSVKADNARELFSCPDVDGGLIGGASLKAGDFLSIAQAISHH